MEHDVMFSVQVCFISPQHQFFRDLRVPEGTTIHQAILLSGLLNEVPELNLNLMKVGIFSKIKSPNTVLKEYDRVEIYRPLMVDPMLARRKRAEKNKK